MLTTMTEADWTIVCNRYEVPRRPQSARAGVAGGHPVLAHGLDDGWNIAVGVAQKFPSLAAPPRWSEQRTPLVVTTVRRMGKSSAWLTSLVSSSGAQSDIRSRMAA